MSWSRDAGSLPFVDDFLSKQFNSFEALTEHLGKLGAIHPPVIKFHSGIARSANSDQRQFAFFFCPSSRSKSSDAELGMPCGDTTADRKLVWMAVQHCSLGSTRM
jgi:hypothetical protein